MYTNHQDMNHPNGCIVKADFNGGEGFYKLHLDYLSKKQVKEVEEMVRTWNKEPKTSNENIKNCVEMCLTDANEQRFEDFGTTLKECLTWLEKQGEKKSADEVLKIRQELYQSGYNDGYKHGQEDITKSLSIGGEQKTDPCTDCTNDKGCVTCEHGELRETHTRTLNADKVIEWMKTHGNLWPRVTIKINEVIDKFKQDFDL